MTKDDLIELDTLERSFSHDTERLSRLERRIHEYLPRLKELRAQKKSADDRKFMAELRKARQYMGEEVYPSE